MRRRRDGEHLTPVQFANDWISADDDNGSSVIVSPRAVVLDPEDFDLFRRYTDRTHVGSFWDEWELREDGTFASLLTRREKAERRRPRPRRR